MSDKYSDFDGYNREELVDEVLLFQGRAEELEATLSEMEQAHELLEQENLRLKLQLGQAVKEREAWREVSGMQDSTERMRLVERLEGGPR